MLTSDPPRRRGGERGCAGAGGGPRARPAREARMPCTRSRWKAHPRGPRAWAPPSPFPALPFCCPAARGEVVPPGPGAPGIRGRAAGQPPGAPGAEPRPHVAQGRRAGAARLCRGPPGCRVLTAPPGCRVFTDPSSGTSLLEHCPDGTLHCQPLPPQSGEGSGCVQAAAGEGEGARGDSTGAGAADLEQQTRSSRLGAADSEQAPDDPTLRWPLPLMRLPSDSERHKAGPAPSSASGAAGEQGTRKGPSLDKGRPLKRAVESSRLGGPVLAARGAPATPSCSWRGSLGEQPTSWAPLSGVWPWPRRGRRGASCWTWRRRSVGSCRGCGRSRERWWRGRGTCRSSRRGS